MNPNQERIDHLKQADPILKMVIEAAEREMKPSLDIDIYASLIESILSQQLSVKVADIIHKRFLDLFEDQYPNPEHVINMDDSAMRAAGLSGRKTQYIKNVAQFSMDNKMDFEYLQTKTDEEIIDYLTAIKGVGRWTVQMILMFPMDRPDVFPVDDLGIVTKMKVLYQVTEEKKALKIKLESLAKSWVPYRTLASRYLWNHKIIKE